MSLSGGVVAGGALAAFITLLQLLPRLTQVTNTRKYVRLYQYIFTIGSLASTIMYFSSYHFNLKRSVVIIVGIFIGIFIGSFSSALAEVLNVIPVLAKKFKIKNEIKYIIYVLALGKVLGSLYFFLYY
nr:stage V sporulation protein AB [Wansuia hejianensis]